MVADFSDGGSHQLLRSIVMRKFARMFVAASLWTLVASFGEFCFSADLLNQTVVAASIAATTTVSTQGDGFVINYQFKNSTYPVGCLSDYDFRYQLRDHAGRVIPLDREGLQGPRRMVTSNPWVTKDCFLWAHGTWSIYSWLGKLYPGLRPGRYTLYITFAPHDTGKS